MGRSFLSESSSPLIYNLRDELSLTTATKVQELSDMLAKATMDARARAENITEFAGVELGDVIEADMGVFQITGQNSNEEYSWGGTFNTSSKYKTASITVKLEIELD